MAFDGTNIWVTSTSSKKITKISPSGSVLGSYDSGPGGQPVEIVFDGTNMLVMCRLDLTHPSKLIKISLSGSIIGSYPLPGLDTNGLAYDGANAWTLDYIAGKAIKISPSGLTTLYSGLNRPMDIAFDSNTNSMWVTSWSTSGIVYKISVVSGVLTPNPGAPAYNGSIAFDGTNMWTASFNTSQITKITPSGGMSIYSFSASAYSNLAFDGTNMWMADYNANSILKISPSGEMTSYGGIGSHPIGIAVVGTNIWIVYEGGSSITKITPGGGSFLNLFQVASAPDGGGTVTNVTPPVSISGSMAPGATRNISTSYTFLTAGTYSVRACADTNILGVGTVTESNEVNNCSAWTNIPVGIVSKTLSVTKTGTGTGSFTMTDGSVTIPSTGINCTGMPCTGTELVLSGGTRVITAYPSFSTVTWTGCNTVVGNVCTLIITTDRAVTATFTAVLPSVDTLTAVPNPVSYDTPSTLSWTASGGVVACYITGGIYTSTDWYGTYVGGASGFVSTGNLIADTPYTVNCHNGAVWALNGKTATVTLPPPPTNQVFTCAPSGTSATISWTPAAGYNTFYLRTRQPDGSTVYYDDNNYVASSYTLDPIIPGQSYNWWVHSKDPTGAYSSWTIQTLKCTGTLKICEGPFLRKLGVANIPLSSSSTTVLTARYGLGDCSTDPAVSAVWAETNTPDNAISLSNPLTGTTVTVTSVSISGPPPKWEDITATYSGNTETARAVVSCVARTCSSLSAQTSTYCPSELQSFDNNCSGMIACPGTRKCNYNYTETSP
jgi:hypothetical protein